MAFSTFENYFYFLKINCIFIKRINRSIEANAVHAVVELNCHAGLVLDIRLKILVINADLDRPTQKYFQCFTWMAI